MGAFLAGLGAAAIASAPQLVNMASSLISSGRADYWHKRDQKHLDKRQDTEIQRRVEDAQSAGINPYDAIGAGAGAGSSTIAHSGAGGLDLGEFNPGAYLDFKVAQESVNQQKEATKQAKIATDIAKLQKNQALRQDILDNQAFAFVTGGSADDYNPWNLQYTWNVDENGNPDFTNSPYMQQLRAGFNKYMNEADMISKQNWWFNANQAVDLANSATGAVGNITGAFSGGFGAYRNYEGGKYFRAQRNYFEPEFTYPKHQMGFHP